MKNPADLSRNLTKDDHHRDLDHHEHHHGDRCASNVIKIDLITNNIIA